MPKNPPDSRPGLSPESLLELAAALSLLDSKYDGSASLLTDQMGAIRYHTRLKSGTPVHPTRESAEYAAALLESGLDCWVRRASDILERLMGLQDTDEGSSTYGIWSWFQEEPLAAMSPPDWNWADFIGTQFAQILWRQGTRLEPVLRGGVESALRHAARSIIRRNVTMGYTNIAIMGTYVTVMAGLLLDDPDLLEYGRKRLRRFQVFTDGWGGFPEYNSPNYAIVALAELARMLRDFPCAADRLIVRDLHDRVWQGIAIHWHVFSGQWSGPHSRSYQTLLSPAISGFLDRGLRPHVSLRINHPPALQEILLPIRCPDEYLPHFSGACPEDVFRQKILDGEPALEGTSYLADKFALASVERGTFWNQARALTAYSRNADGPTAWHVRFLRDGYDYSSANVMAAQNGASILGTVCFANDGGNLHCSLDRISDATVEASDWRLRFQCHGTVRLAELPAQFSTEDVVDFGLSDGVVLSLRVPWLRFGDFQPRWESAPDGVDLVWYAGAPRTFVFDGGFSCAAGFAVTVNGAGDSEAVRAGLNGDVVELEWPLPRGTSSGPPRRSWPGESRRSRASRGPSRESAGNESNGHVCIPVNREVLLIGFASIVSGLSNGIITGSGTAGGSHRRTAFLQTLGFSRMRAARRWASLFKLAFEPEIGEAVPGAVGGFWIDVFVCFHDGFAAFDAAHAASQIFEQLGEGIDLRLGGGVPIEVAHQTDADGDVVEIIAGNMAAIDLSPPAVADFNLSVARGTAVANDEMVGQTVLHFSHVLVVVIERLGIALPRAAVVNDDVFPTAARDFGAVNLLPDHSCEITIARSEEGAACL